MDDNTFDDLVKKKLKEYKDPSFDPVALENLHERLNQFGSESWFNRNSAKLAIAAAMIIFTCINAYLLAKNYYLHQSQTISHDEFLTKQKNTVDSLYSLVHQLQLAVYEKKQLPEETNYRSPQLTIHFVKSFDSENVSDREVVYKISMGKKSNIPNDVYQKLNDQGLLEIDNDEVVLLIPRRTLTDYNTSVHTRMSDLLMPTTKPGTLVLIDMNREKIRKTDIPVLRSSESSLQARNLLEKHYFNGLGIQIAPHLDLMKGVYSIGEGKLTPRVGVTADWILSPRIGVETGVDYSAPEINFSKNEIPFHPSGSQLGDLSSGVTTNKMVSLPISLKYRQWIFDKSQLIVRAGYTPYGILSRQIQYNYIHYDYSNPDADGDLITTLEKRNEHKFLGSTFTSSIGLQIKREKNKGLWEASLFYEKSLGQGFENNSTQFFGLRTAYWFKVK